MLFVVGWWWKDEWVVFFVLCVFWVLFFSIFVVVYIMIYSVECVLYGVLVCLIDWLCVVSWWIFWWLGYSVCRYCLWLVVCCWWLWLFLFCDVWFSVWCWVVVVCLVLVVCWVGWWFWWDGFFGFWLFIIFDWGGGVFFDIYRWWIVVGFEDWLKCYGKYCIYFFFYWVSVFVIGLLNVLCSGVNNLGLIMLWVKLVWMIVVWFVVCWVVILMIRMVRLLGKMVILMLWLKWGKFRFKI